ncbi:MAG TPA: bis(5'-nucleosyl)-tetraphosphatase (symmetrical) YqeK, partial [Bacillota bacterium]|nr:bis(5'-nucleosyl)-tetraphosphatase (symmetrical) YqeK [Bacillota bacterium]
IEWAEKMAVKYNVNRDQARLAALFHDCAKNLSNEELLEQWTAAGFQPDEWMADQPDLLHGPVGALIAEQEFGVSDAEVLQAIARHTLGGDDMTPLDKIIFLADMVEVNRSFPGVEALRALTMENLDKAMITAVNKVIEYLLQSDAVIHPQTLRTRNILLTIYIRH